MFNIQWAGYILHFVLNTLEGMLTGYTNRYNIDCTLSTVQCTPHSLASHNTRAQKRHHAAGGAAPWGVVCRVLCTVCII